MARIPKSFQSIYGREQGPKYLAKTQCPALKKLGVNTGRTKPAGGNSTSRFFINLCMSYL